MSTYETFGPSSYDDSWSSSDSAISKKKRNRSRAEQLTHTAIQLLCSRDFLQAFLYGQGLSILLCGTGVFSALLQDEGVDLPAAQSFLMYCILFLVFTTQVAYRQGQRNMFSILKSVDGLKYFFIGLIDVEANYMVVKAYGFTSITSVQVLDCFNIATVLLLSRLLLKTHYRAVHYIGVAISVCGVGGLVAADVITGRNDGDSGSNVALGDILVIAGSILYGVSNVAQEFVVKTYSKAEFLGMLAFFSTIVSGIQIIIFERDDIAQVDFTSYKIALPWIGFVIFLFLIYISMAYVIQKTSATVTTISVLSADFYALLFGIFIFNYTFHFLYLIAFFIVILGVAVYSFHSTEPTPGTVNSDEATEGQLIKK